MADEDSIGMTIRLIYSLFLLLEVPIVVCSGGKNHTFGENLDLRGDSLSHLSRMSLSRMRKQHLCSLLPSTTTNISLTTTNKSFPTELKPAPIVIDNGGRFLNYSNQADVCKKSVISDSDVYYESLKNLLMHVVSSDMKECFLTILYGVEFRGSPIIDALIGLPNLKQVVEVTSPSIFYNILWEAPQCRGYIFLQLDPKNLFSFVSRTDFVWDFHGRYVIVGWLEEHLKLLFPATKIHNTENVIGIIKYSRVGELGIYTNWASFGASKSRVAAWKGNSFANLEPNLFPDKLKNFFNRPLKVTGFEYRPATIYLRSDDGTVLERYGRDDMIAKGLTEALNATLDYIEGNSGEMWGAKLPNGSFDGLTGILERNEAYLAVANFYISTLSGRHVVYDFSAPIGSSVSCFMIRKPKPLPKWERILYPFKILTWIAIFAGLILNGPIFYAFCRAGKHCGGEKHDMQSLSFAYLYTVGLHFMEGQVITPTRMGVRVYIAFLWIYATIITTGYSSNLTALLTVARQPPTIDTIEDLYQSKLEIGGMGNFYRVAMEKSTNPLLNGLAARFTKYNTASRKDLLKKVGDGYVVSVANENSQRYIAQMEFTKNRVSSVRFMKEPFSSFSLCIAVRRGSPLKRRISDVINRMVQGGLIHHWFLTSIRRAKDEADDKIKASQDNSPKKKDDEDDGVQPLSFDHLEGFFFILVVGYFTALLVFSVECSIQKLSCCKY